MRNKKQKEKTKKTKIILWLAGLALGVVWFSVEGVSAAETETTGQPDLAGLKNELGADVQPLADPQTGRMKFLSRPGNKALFRGKGKSGRDNSREFLRKFGQYFGVENPGRDLELLKEAKDRFGNSHLKYSQKWQGVPVYGGQLIVHMKDKKTVKAVNGETNVSERLDPNPKLDSDAAVAQAKKIWKEKEKGDPELQGTPRLYVYNKKFLAKQLKDDRNYLVWEIDLWAPDPYQHKIYFINARNGTLTDQRDAVKKAVSRRVFNCHNWTDYSACVLEDTIDGVDHGRSEGVAARGIADIDNLYDYTGSIHNYFSATFGRDGANTHGGLGDNTINPFDKTDSYGRIDNDPYRGAYCPDNAFFDDSVAAGGANINFCDGSATKDVVGHEYTHGVSYFSITDSYGDPSGLDYYYESGALEEGDADVFGEAIEYYIDGSNDWKLGEGIASGPFRSMSEPGSILDPGIGGYPPRFGSANFYCDIWDNGGVHHNSTVVSHAAYLMAMGGNYNGCDIGAIGRAKEEAVFYKAINDYFTPSTDFNGAYAALNSACADLYGAGSADCANVKKALRSVEMDQPGACSGVPATAPQCDFSTAPTIASVSSSKANGSYRAGSIIDIGVYFSEPVTSAGGVTVNLNTGGSCSFNVTASSQGSCDYVAGPNENTELLDVSSISGTITDSDGNAMSNFSPASNLSQNKAIKIDNIPPVISGVADGQTYNTDVAPTFNEGTAVLNGGGFASDQPVSQEGDYLLAVTDDAGNSTSVSFSIEKVSASLTSIPYSPRKNNRRIVFTVYGLNLPGKLKARYFRVRLNGRRIKILSARNSGGNTLLNTRQNYRRWPAGDYNFALNYNYKIKKTRYQGAATSDYVLTIQ